MTAAALLLALLAAPPTCPAVARVLGPDAARAPVVAALSARGLAPGAACGWRISVRSTADGLLISGRPPGRAARSATVSTPGLAAVLVASWLGAETQGSLRSALLHPRTAPAVSTRLGRARTASTSASRRGARANASGAITRSGRGSRPRTDRDPAGAPTEVRGGARPGMGWAEARADAAHARDATQPAAAIARRAVDPTASTQGPAAATRGPGDGALPSPARPLADAIEPAPEAAGGDATSAPTRRLDTADAGQPAETPAAVASARGQSIGADPSADAGRASTASPPAGAGGPSRAERTAEPGPAEAMAPPRDATTARAERAAERDPAEPGTTAPPTRDPARAARLGADETAPPAPPLALASAATAAPTPVSPPPGGLRDDADVEDGDLPPGGQPRAVGVAPVARASRPRVKAFLRPQAAMDERAAPWWGAEGGAGLAWSSVELRLILRARTAAAAATASANASATDQQALEALFGVAGILPVARLRLRAGAGAGAGGVRSARGAVAACPEAACAVDEPRIQDGFATWTVHPRVGAWAEVSFALGAGFEGALTLDATLDPVVASALVPTYAEALPEAAQASLALAAPARFWAGISLGLAWEGGL